MQYWPMASGTISSFLFTVVLVVPCSTSRWNQVQFELECKGTRGGYSYLMSRLVPGDAQRRATIPVLGLIRASTTSSRGFLPRAYLCARASRPIMVNALHLSPINHEPRHYNIHPIIRVPGCEKVKPRQV